MRRTSLLVCSILLGAFGCGGPTVSDGDAGPSNDGGGSTSDGGTESDGGMPGHPTFGNPDCEPVDYCGPSNGTVIQVADGGDLQAALNTAAPGDTIELAAGATFTGNFELPTKDGEGCITVRTSTPDSMLPERGARITPASAPMLARIVAGGTSPAVRATNGAHHYRFVGIEFGVQAGTYNYGIVEFGTGQESTLDDVPHHFVLDHVYVHGDPTSGAKRCIQLNSASTTVVDSYVSDCKGVGQDTQAIGAWNGPGPFRIVNNELEGAGENVMFGGATNHGEEFVATDVAVCYNHIFKPQSWHVSDPAYEGTHWTVKNLFELKAARRVLVEGNLLEQNWVDAQVGFAFVLTPRTENGNNPWNVVEDVRITNNIIRATNDGLNVAGHDDAMPTLLAQRIAVANNLWVEVGSDPWGSSGGGRLFQVLGGATDVTFEHNTALQTAHILVFDGAAAPGFVFQNNIAPHNRYGVFGSGSGIGNSALAMYAPDGVFTGNVIAALPSGVTPASYPEGNFFPESIDAIGFMDQAGGDYALGADSPYAGMATDGTDPGVDWAALQAAQSYRSE